MKTLHLVCNAHLDPVWLWEWEEGAAEAISTFRTAAELCEEFDGFVFNHNEVILYRWVEEYEPALFAHIQDLVKRGRWHIMGGWYLQPDCNMPSGESFVRQILAGRRYFGEKFGTYPTTAINFDPFGHTRGLVQIMAKSGYDSYIFCRPGPEDCPLPADDFVWLGYDGSQVTATRFPWGYNSPLGGAGGKVQNWLSQHADRPVGMVLWGVGNHGGGPSRQDLRDLGALIETAGEVSIKHSTPEAYFADLREHGPTLPRHDGDLNSWAVGCYTSQVRLKQKHRRLENELYAVEKMLSHAAVQGRLAYSQADLQEATRDLLTAEFHDILPGSSIQPVEDTSLRLMEHGLELLSRLKARAFFALAAGQPRAAEGEIPILVYNPHPCPVAQVFECEFQLADQNWKEEFTLPRVFHNGVLVPSQAEKEQSNLNLDWRKRVAFQATLAPAQMNRFDCRLEILPRKPIPALQTRNGVVHFHTADLDVSINAATGLMDTLRVGGLDIVRPSGFRPLVIRDSDDSWGMTVQQFRDVMGEFSLMSPEDGTHFSGVHAGILPSVRVIEDGDARTVIEALLSYDDSYLVLTYKLPKQGTEIEVQARVLWNQKSQMLKLSLPSALADAELWGQVAYGRDRLRSDGREAVAQQWAGVISASQDAAMTLINEGCYGLDFADGELRLSLLRSPAYSGHPIMDRPIMPQDRFSPRIDQGERLFRFWLNAGPLADRLEHIDQEALAHNEAPFVLSFFPAGAGESPLPGAMLDDATVQLTAFKQAEDGGDFILRLFEPTGRVRTTRLSIPPLGLEQTVSLTPFEIKTLRLNVAARTLTETDLMEQPLGE